MWITAFGHATFAKVRLIIPRLVTIVVISPTKSLFVTVSACAEIPFTELISQMLGKVECLPWTWGRGEAFIELKLKYIVTMHKTAMNCDNGSNLPIASTLTHTSLWGSVCVHWFLQLAPLRGFRLCMLWQAPQKTALNPARFAMPCLFPLAGL